MTFSYPGHSSGLGENLDQVGHRGVFKSWPEDTPSFVGTDPAPLSPLNSFQRVSRCCSPQPHPIPGHSVHLGRKLSLSPGWNS